MEVLEGHCDARGVEARVSVIEPLFGLALYERIEIPPRPCAKQNATRIEDKGFQEQDQALGVPGHVFRV